MPIDIDKSYYNTGTASVENGERTVTGQSTLWVQALRPGDLFGTHAGYAVRIASVDSNTELTLAHDWPGETQTADPYEVQLTPYDVGYQQAVRILLTTLSSGNLEALAALVGGEDKVPYFTGAGAMDLIDVADLTKEDELALKEDKAAKNVASGYAGLDSSGKIPESLLPAIAITEPFPVENEEEMLDLVAEVGDVAIRSDVNKTFILAASPASTLENWIELRSPTDAVQSVAGKTGVVTLEADDIDGLGDAATKDVGTAAGTVAAGDDARITGALPKGGATGIGGFTSAGYDVGSLSGTIALDPENGNFQYGSKNGNTTFSALPDGFYSLELRMTNTSSPGTCTISGVNKTYGTYKTTSGLVQRITWKVSGSNKVVYIEDAS